MPGSSWPSGFGNTARSVTAPVLSLTVTPVNFERALVSDRGCRRSSSSRTLALCAPALRLSAPAASWRAAAARSALDCVRSTYIGSSCCTVVSGLAWLAVTSAPSVKAEVAMRPAIGATMRV